MSALGYALGYIGGGLLFAFNVWMVLRPATFGLADSSEAVRWSLRRRRRLVGGVHHADPRCWCPKPARPADPPGHPAIVGAGFRQLFATFREIRRLRVVLLFLLGYWLYIDGVDTVIAHGGGLWARRSSSPRKA